MRYSPEHKAETRKKLLEAGAAIAKKNGFATTGVDGFMEKIGLSGAAFYNHFGSKADFFKAILEHELECSRAILTTPGTLTPEERIKAYLDMYLSLAHVQNPEHGCPLPALSQEVAGADAETKGLYEEEVLRTHAAMEECLGDSNAAWAALAQSVGTVLIARAMKTKKSQEALLSGCRAYVAEMLKKQKK
ncbi:MAG: TetR/AcrR family transcriptional regulator [Bdellovibrionota bacterium]